jgi:Polyketide cyclase / dehydrase and lipid transport
MSMVQQAIEVGAPLHTVYEQLATFENYPKFMTGVERVTPIGSDRTHWVMDVDGRRREFDAQITERSPGRRLSWSAMDGPRLAETITLRPMGELRTQVVAQLEADAAFLTPSDRHAQETLNRRLERDLTTFKGLVESGVLDASRTDGPPPAAGSQRPGGTGAADGSVRTGPVSPATVAARIKRRGDAPHPGAGWGTGTTSMVGAAVGAADDDARTPGRRIAGRSGPLSGGVGGGRASTGEHVRGTDDRGDAVIHEEDRGGSLDH